MLFPETNAMDTGLSHGKGSMGNERQMHKDAGIHSRDYCWTWVQVEEKGRLKRTNF